MARTKQSERLVYAPKRKQSETSTWASIVGQRKTVSFQLDLLLRDLRVPADDIELTTLGLAIKDELMVFSEGPHDRVRVCGGMSDIRATFVVTVCVTDEETCMKHACGLACESIVAFCYKVEIETIDRDVETRRAALRWHAFTVDMFDALEEEEEE